MSRAQSQEGSATWSGADPEWIEYVGWDGEFHPLDDVTYHRRPEAENLKKIVEKSLIAPAWMANIESPEWAVYNKGRLRHATLHLSLNMPLAEFTFKNDDEELSFDVQESLAFILHIPRHAAALKLHCSDIKPVEADRRHPVDTLGFLVWNLQSDGRVVYRTERKLAIPCLPTQENTGQVQSDACAFIYLPLTTPPVAARAALSTTADNRFAPHWVTEYKRDHDELGSKDQVAEGLVSALYQRRAYGFPNHFVFGSAHYSRTTIEVLAATWVRSDEFADPGARSQGAKTASAVSPEDPKTNPADNSLQQGDRTSRPPKTGKENTDANASLTIKDIKKYNKIVMFSIAKYDMTAVENMLQLYLLMRHTLTLAQQYADEVEKDRHIRVRELMKEAKEIYDWPPPPRPKPDEGMKRQRTGRSNFSPAFSATPESKRDDMSIEPYDDSNYSSDSEELEPPNDTGPLLRVAGEVASYTLRNYAYEEDAVTCNFGDPNSDPVS
ncbi:hypothetical protein V565_313450 [Rhizoctonia solani 123E]|uniref:Uncharacterized protein n=1 Tax=Rhizoctonia solani 123E TaxID=1423351 RepID=A0A074RIB4_9AGAM|nr:hypothetical protein V565_313450 [Rhizoctonia solani 123E]